MEKRVLVLAPHPDDECIVGLLPLRLKEECGFRVWVVPATLGSRPDRRRARLEELETACGVLDFRLRLPPRLLRGPAAAEDVCRALESVRPNVVFLPHAQDGHVTHRAVHRLGLAAMERAGKAFHVVETEYWHPMREPNLMVSADGAQLDLLRRALACHAGEIARNDYAARLPAWMIDNVRRGAERVGGAGAAAPHFDFAALYRARRRERGAWRSDLRGKWIVESSEDVGRLAAAWKEPT